MDMLDALAERRQWQMNTGAHPPELARPAGSTGLATAPAEASWMRPESAP